MSERRAAALKIEMQGAWSKFERADIAAEEHQLGRSMRHRAERQVTATLQPPRGEHANGCSGRRGDRHPGGSSSAGAAVEVCRGQR